MGVEVEEGVQLRITIKRSSATLYDKFRIRSLIGLLPSLVVVNEVHLLPQVHRRI